MNSLYADTATLKEMALARAAVRTPQTTPPATTARIPPLKQVMERKKVTIKWILWQVAQEQLHPRAAAWAMCPDVNPLHSGYVKMIGHAVFILERWRAFFQECGWDDGEEAVVKQELLKLWGLKEDRPCHLRPEN